MYALQKMNYTNPVLYCVFCFVSKQHDEMMATETQQTKHGRLVVASCRWFQARTIEQLSLGATMNEYSDM